MTHLFATTSLHNDSVDKKSGHFQSPGFRNKSSSGKLDKNPSTGGSKDPFIKSQPNYGLS